MKKVFIAASLLFSLHGWSQENLWWKTPVNSPEVNNDNTVTFRLKAPKATTVEVVGDFLKKDEKAEMKKVDNDVWEYTTPKSLNPELYSYAFMMDGVKISDPSNVFMSRDVVTMINLFMIDGKESDLYKVHSSKLIIKTKISLFYSINTKRTDSIWNRSYYFVLDNYVAVYNYFLMTTLEAS